jgi:hypothetical protein
MIRSCERLESFKYIRPLRRFVSVPLDSQVIYGALLCHSNTLKELVVEDGKHQTTYDKTPKFGSFQTFSALQKLGVECNALTSKTPLPPALRAIGIGHCDLDGAGELLLHIGRHPSLKAIQFEYNDGGYATFFQKYQSRGLIRKDIQVNIVGLSEDPNRPRTGYSDYPLL